MFRHNRIHGRAHNNEPLILHHINRCLSEVDLAMLDDQTTVLVDRTEKR